MTYPRVNIDLKKIEHNTRVLVDKCKKSEIEVAGVTKVFCAFPEIAKAMVDGGVSVLADSRVENLKRLKAIDRPKLLLRLPMISQVEELVEHVDISLNSEIETIKAISKAALRQEKEHKIILMVDLGDLREGIFKMEEVFDTIAQIVDLRGVKLIGIGTNLTCYGGIMPKEDNLGELVALGREIEERFSIKLEIISGGNSSSLYLLDKGNIPSGINQLRLGESIVLGRETAFGDKIDNTYEDCFKLEVELIEIKEKPSMPIGEIGMDAFGNKPTFEDRGNIIRGICAIGKQDVDPGSIAPDDEKISILGASSDHLILDLTNTDREYRVGDKVTFNLSYGSILSTMTSEYIYKNLVK